MPHWITVAIKINKSNGLGVPKLQIYVDAPQSKRTEHSRVEKGEFIVFLKQDSKQNMG